MVNAFETFDLAIGAVSGIGLVYLAYIQRSVGYRRFFYFIVAGILLFAVGGPLVDLVKPHWLHAVHGVAALFVILGLYDPVHNDLRKNEWAQLMLQEPSEMRHPAAWMTPMDDEILELFHSATLVLTPAIIAYNIDRSREEVNRRLSSLGEYGLVERVERGKYRIAPRGEKYLQGEL